MIPRRFSSVCCAAFASLIAPILLVAQGPSSDGLGGAHGRLAAYQGEWVVTLTQPESGASVARGSGTAGARLRLDGRFLEIETSVDGGPVRQTVHMLGYDMRHGKYTIVLFDNTGTYFVTASSEPDATPPRIALYGVDDDPTMKAMGLDKEFVFVVNMESPDRFRIETRFIDTRTNAREEHSFMTLEFRRVAP